MEKPKEFGRSPIFRKAQALASVIAATYVSRRQSDLEAVGGRGAASSTITDVSTCEHLVLWMREDGAACQERWPFFFVEIAEGTQMLEERLPQLCLEAQRQGFHRKCPIHLPLHWITYCDQSPVS
eukprot:CAMPEP_0178381102 /NCGR_PEP_ID=MMETSP0689_2-20121128/5809_1 /TAXON_ID=160604 /ORGANISM="Amphidinium massartii, Strain CS-259" /LENGTH=124 /DNA_ID=CAMNT_0020001273 /DNA_START=493 /DNA_END=866 /DNA_ORIENTATION=-